MRKLGIVVCTLLALAFSSGAAKADEDYPAKPIQLICPYGAGGLTDIVARQIAEKMGKILGQTVVVVNKTGGGTAIGTGFVASSKPDGYTMLINMTGGFVVTPLIVPDLPYKMSDLRAIGKVASANYVVIANRDLPVKNLPELIAYGKQNKLAFATPGVGTVNHLSLEQLNVDHKLGMPHLPYNSELQVMNALLGNHVQVGAVTIPSSLRFIQSNQVKALAVLADKRSPTLGDVATSAEQGFPEMVASLYNILFVPSKTPAPVIKKLEDALRKALQDEDVVRNLNKMELAIDFTNSADTQAFLDDEVKKWGAAVAKTKVKNN